MISDTELDLAIKRERKLKKLNEQRYRKALKLEKDRERKHRVSDQGKFEASFASLDELIDKSDKPDKMTVLSNGGTGARSMYNVLDYPDRVRRLEAARERIKESHPEWLEVFDLIVKNGTNRKESIWEMVSKKLQNGTLQRTDTGTT